MKKSVLTAAALVLAMLTGAQSAWADMKFAQEKNCMACHSVDRKIMGPSFKQIAAKYAGDKEAVNRLTTKVIKGGSGTWGAAAMPPNEQVTETEAKKLVVWILSLK